MFVIASAERTIAALEAVPIRGWKTKHRTAAMVNAIAIPPIMTAAAPPNIVESAIAASNHNFPAPTTLPTKAGTQIERIHMLLRCCAQTGIAIRRAPANSPARTSGKASASGAMSKTAIGRSHQTAFARIMLSNVLPECVLPDESIIEGSEGV